MQPSRRRTFLPTARIELSVLVLALALAVAAAVSGCSDSTSPSALDQTSLQATFKGSMDPNASSFVLESAPATQPGQAPVAVELIGSNLVVDPNAPSIALDVAIKNSSNVTLYGPALVHLSDFAPPGVTPDEVDLDYSSLLGDDGALSPGETSATRTWRFTLPSMTSFSFSATATFGAQPATAVIAGTIFNDDNSNGVRDPGEVGFYGIVKMVRPDGMTLSASASDSGAYSLPIQSTGLHTLTYTPPLLRCACEVTVTTPNPLRVVVVPDSNGEPQSYLHADFGVHVGPVGQITGPVVLTDLPPEQIHQDFYQLLSIDLSGDLLSLRVGFSGCAPDHGFTLYMTGGFMESNPVQAHLLLSHDAHGELCDAYWERTLVFDLTPLRMAFEQSYGSPGPVQLNFFDFQGQEHSFLYAWGPPTGVNLLPNGGFEINGRGSLEGWEVNNPDLTGLVRLASPDGISYVLRLLCDWAPPSAFVRAPVVGVSSGEPLRLSALIQGRGTPGGGMMYLQSGNWRSDVAFNGDPAWKRVSLIAQPVIAPGDSLYVVLSAAAVEITVGGAGLFDDVVLERVATPTISR